MFTSFEVIFNCGYVRPYYALHHCSISCTPVYRAHCQNPFSAIRTDSCTVFLYENHMIHAFPFRICLFFFCMYVWLFPCDCFLGEHVNHNMASFLHCLFSITCQSETLPQKSNFRNLLEELGVSNFMIFLRFYNK